MRLEELRLVAYGPFDGQVLSFSRERGIVDVVFGGNEAGKSTSLRALEAFFFGMEHTTPDAHRHRGPDLRVAGKIVTADGSVVDLVRRKARKASLRDAADEPVDEAVMQRLLSGVDRELFRALWGLDHVRLREGARAIFAGKGGVGETLFEAGLAGAGASRLAQTLLEEAEVIWSPRATTRPLAEALRSLGELRRLAQRDGTTFKGYQDQVDGIAEARREKETLDAELRGIDEERRRLDRAVRVIGPLAERRALVRERAALGDVRLLPEDATRERERALLEQATASSALAELDLKLAALGARADALGPPVALPFDPGDAESDLSAARGRVRAHRDKADALRVERATLAASLVSAGPDLDDADARRLLARVKRAAAARSALTDAREALAEAEAARTSARARLDAAGDPPAIAGLESARLEALRALERRDALRSARERARLARTRAEAAFLALGLFDGTLDELATRRAPAEEQVREDARAVERRDAELVAASAELARLDARLAELAREEDELLAAGEVPTEDDLAAARRARDAEIAGAFEDAALRARALAEVERADGVADRLRREASRVGRFAAVRAEQAMHRRSRDAAAQRSDAASRAASAARDAAANRFAAMGVRPLDPAAMLDWLRRRAAIVADLADAAAESANVAAFEEAERDARVHLARALGAPLDASLEHLVERVDEVVTTAATKVRERERAREALAAAEATEAKLAAVTELRAAEATTSDAETVAQLARAGLDAALDEDAVRGEIDDRRRARTARAALARVDAELELAAEAERRLETIVASIELALGGSATEGDVALRAERVGLELRRARERTEASRALDAERAEIVKRRDDALALRARAEATLEAHVVRAGVASVAALEEAERRSSRARELGLRITEIEAALRAAGDGAAPGELEAEVEHLDEETLLSEQGELEDRREEVTKRRDEAFHREVTWRMGLERFEESNAAEHAARAEVSRARAHALAARWIRLRLASVVLEREMEAYRRAFQDPLLGRASELFAKLTSGSFERLAVRLSDKDRPELVCVRAGREIGVDGLSDGTRDQLYLALRLATIERHARHADPLPLVLDDVLVHFDDERSALALELFADVAETVQVILFTHHERIALLARERLGGRAHVLRLSR